MPHWAKYATRRLVPPVAWLVVTEIWLLSPDRLPAPSRARTRYVYVVFGARPVSV
jgi:hypothetical protein